MKRKFTQICVAMLMLMAGTSYAATITATVSGNWSNATTWSGGSASGTVGLLDNIVIPAGITVTLDMDVQVNVGGTINVSGMLNSTGTHSLMINNSGTLSGNGDMNLYYLELSALSTMSYNGDLMVNRFITSATSLTLGAQITLADTMYLKAGTLTLGSGSLLMLNTNSNIKVEDGTLAITSGIFTATNNYDVMYVGSTKTTGLELSGTGAKHMHVQLSSSTQSLSLSGDYTVNGALYHNMGTLNLNGHHLTLAGNYNTMNNAMIAGSATSDLTVNTLVPLNSGFSFVPGAQMLNNLLIDYNNNSFTAMLESDLTVYGFLNINKGNLNAGTHTIKMNTGSTVVKNQGALTFTTGGTFDGSSTYNVLYLGGSKNTDMELSGAGLNNVIVDLNSSTDSVEISNHVVIDGIFNMNKGALNLKGFNLTLNGTIASTNMGYLQVYPMSDITINTAAGLGDTLNISTAFNKMHNLSINTGNGSNLMLNGTDLWVENMTFVDGGVTIYNNNLYINSTGTINGYDMNNYVTTKGSGSLMMNVNLASPYVTFPVGTTSGYSPAQIQKTAGANGMIGVNTNNGVWTNGTSGVNYATGASIVDRTWYLSSATTGSTSMSMRLGWNTAMEVNSFNRNSAYITQYTSNWDNMTASTATTTGTGTYMLQRDNITSFGPFAVVDNLSSVSVKELADNNNVSFYPNPVTENVTMTVKNTGAYTIEVFDAVGNKVISKIVTTEPSTKVDLSSLNTGIYFVKISDDKTQSIKKIIKQ